MADPRGFMKFPREHPQRRDVEERVKDWNEVYPGGPAAAFLPIIPTQAARCMDCGIPFCHYGCPLGNIIPEWNDLVWRDDWQAASDRLHATNNFPEFTGRLCPAPCETACVVGINGDPVAIKGVEVSIAERAWDDRFIQPQAPDWHTGYTVAVVGSGPSGLAVAQQLTRVGHTVAVFERADVPGGLLRYGIPEFKMEKSVLDRRIRQMKDEGTLFRTGVTIGADITWTQLKSRYDAVVVAMGSTKPRDLPAPGRELAGIHFAMDYLPQANRVARGRTVEDQIVATDKHVVVIGGGDTGSDCIGTALRQGAASVTQLEIFPAPGEDRPANQPWPTYPAVWRVSTSQEEGGERIFEASTTEFIGDEEGHVRQLRLVEVKPNGSGGFNPVEGSERVIPADMVVLAMGFVGPQAEGLVDELGVSLDRRGNVARDENFMTGVEGVFACGDAGRGQSLIVWAIAEGRSCAAGVDAFLSGSTKLPRPIGPQVRPMTL
ncbi:glutamate synthase subunit beta [Raineyella sp. W15-4]|uniref:glutamate synthase subunit beta n=1 Tax=Raineyella sp. W15-4 TaxID=3081651 RepID=UPI0029540D7F|nr:glutamate synthase subunit beta [Raineyella sp. W15-4]WOQ15476.1 glutamate synthase subunit beta [Raineyella sp. W15-4]